jgi:hypothetical protein
LGAVYDQDSLPRADLARRPIAESAAKSEEIRKLYSEILQLDNQRFLLTTTAVVLFASVAGWVTTGVLRSSPDASSRVALSYLPLASSFLLWLVLGVLFYFQSSKAKTIRWLAAYLLLQGSSWEWTWHEFRKLEGAKSLGTLPFYQIHRMATWTFSVLNIASLVYFAVLQFSLLGRAHNKPGLPWVWAALALLTGISVWLMHRGSKQLLEADERAYMERWAIAERRGCEQREIWGRLPPISAGCELGG